MQVKGEHTFKITKSELWHFLMDPEVLAKITPGVSKLETIDTDHYKSISDIKIGPVKGSFKGKLKVVDKNEPESFTIEMEQLSKIGNAHGKIAMNLADIESDSAQLSFDGKVNLSGVIARTGQRVLSGVANTITKEVFASLEQHIEEVAITHAVSPETASVVPETIDSDISIDEAKSAEESTTQSVGLWSWIGNLFKKLFG